MGGTWFKGSKDLIENTPCSIGCHPTSLFSHSTFSLFRTSTQAFIGIITERFKWFKISMNEWKIGLFWFWKKFSKKKNWREISNGFDLISYIILPNFNFSFSLTLENVAISYEISTISKKNVERGFFTLITFFYKQKHKNIYATQPHFKNRPVIGILITIQNKKPIRNINYILI